MKHSIALSEQQAQDVQVSNKKLQEDQNRVNQELSKIEQERAKMDEEKTAFILQQAQ